MLLPVISALTRALSDYSDASCVGALPQDAWGKGCGGLRRVDSWRRPSPVVRAWGGCVPDPPRACAVHVVHVRTLVRVAPGGLRWAGRVQPTGNCAWPVRLRTPGVICGGFVAEFNDLDQR